jgi:hypothetical protein
MPLWQRNVNQTDRSPMSTGHPREGYRYVVTTAFEAIVLTQWLGPFTGGSQKLIPAGLEFVVAADPLATATAVTAKPDPSDLWETLLVDEQDRTADKYGGYSLVIPFERLETNCSRR